MGRQPKLTPEVAAKILGAIRAGNYDDAACGAAGVHFSTFYRWLQKGEQAKSGRYREFREALMRARTVSEFRCVLSWTKASDGDWRAAQAFLERRFPDRWGARNKLEHSVAPAELESSLVRVLDAIRAKIKDPALLAELADEFRGIVGQAEGNDE